MSKFRRTLFYDKNEVNGIVENDLVKNYFDLFKIKRPSQYFTLGRSYLQRPDLLSLKLYGTMNYWWIIAKLNKIDDWWNDVEIGAVIQYPDIQDIQDFYLEVRKFKKV
jgi:hypothetical protein